MLLSQYLPPFLSQTKTLSSILNSDQIEINTLNNNVQDIINQCFVSTATWGLTLWENFVGIKTDVTKDLNFRRTSILAKLRGYGTITPSSIQIVASSFVNGDVEVIEHPSNYSFEIKFTSTLGVPPNIADLQNTIDLIKPAHLAVTYTYLYQQWSNVGASTWNTAKTGTWNDLLNGVVI